MDWSLFTQIIDQAATFPSITHVTLTGLGEPLLDSHIFRRLTYVREMMPSVELDLTTNGHLLTPVLLQYLVDVPLSCLTISLNAANATKREAIMGLRDYWHVVAMCHEARRLGLRLRVSVVVAKDLLEGAEQEALRETWGESAFLVLEGNWAGHTGRARVPMTTPCPRAMYDIMVLWDGRVVPCCFDGEGQMVFGDLARESLADIFAGSAAASFRRAHAEGRRREVPLCAGCTSI